LAGTGTPDVHEGLTNDINELARSTKWQPPRADRLV